MFYPRVLLILAALAIDITCTLAQDGADPVTDVTTVATVATPQPCVTGKREEGTCVKREKCEYGTAAIDFSLYRPRGYKLPCNPEDVCCPPQYLVQQDDRVWVPENDGFDFDDDD